jgi:chaperonin cofactor prefoldin
LRRKNHIGAKRQREAVEELDRSCGKLEDEIRILEKRVRDLYRQLVSIRTALLGILSQP